MGEKRKFKWPAYSWYDYRGIEEELTKMASIGWEIERMRSGLWIYKKTEPANKKFQVVFSKDGYTDWAGPSESIVALEEMCAETGWKMVGQYEEMVIFCAEDEEAVTLVTDELAMLESIRESKKPALTAQLVSMAIVTALLILYLVIVWPVEGYFDPPMLKWMYPVQIFALISLVGLNVGKFLLWVKASRENIACGGTCDDGKRVERIFMHLSRIIACAVIIFFIACITVTVG